MESFESLKGRIWNLDNNHYLCNNSKNPGVGCGILDRGGPGFVFL